MTLTPLTPEQWRQVNALFDQAVELPDPERVAYVKEHTGADPSVRREVLALLSAHSESSAFLEQPVAHLSPATTRQSQLSRLSERLQASRVLKAGDVVGDFEIIRLLGQGAFARVYVARQKSLGRSVALKVTANIGNVGREARTMAGLEHDHIVTVFSETVDAAANSRMICMQLVTGTTLQQLITKLGRLAPEERSGAAILELIDEADASNMLFNAAAVKDRENLARMDFYAACLWIGARLAEALDFAHTRGILHLDVKPANILLNRYGRPMLTDFNVALSAGDIANRDATRLGGTVHYMSPEHYAAFTAKSGPEQGALIAAIDGRADIYSLGIVLAELLTCTKVERQKSITEQTAQLPEEIASVLHLAVQAAPEKRFSDAGELGAALENCRDIAAIRRNMPKSRLLGFANRTPVAAIVILTILPQFLGSVVNITYNTVRITPELTAGQQDVFMDLLLPYNIVFYPLGIWILWRQVAFVWKSLNSRSDRIVPNPDSMAVLRLRLLQMPYALLFATSLGWLPGAYIFPAAIDYLAGPVSSHVYGHFGISFVSSWLIALTYSFLLLESVTLLVLYPRFWTGCCNIRAASRFELRKVGRRLRLFQVLAGLIPLAGAMMIVGAGPDITDPRGYYVFQVMVVSLIALGMLGFVFAMRASENIKRTVSAFTG